MKRILFLFLLISSFAYGQQKTVQQLLHEDSTYILPKPYYPTYAFNMHKDVINSSVNLLGSYSNPSWLTSLSWSKITSTPSTLTGYGISLSPGNVFVGNGSSVPTGVSVSGDGTLSSSGALSVTKILGNTVPSNSTGALTNDGAGNLSWVQYVSVPTGIMMDWPTTSAPSGWLICDGSAVSRATYSNLFAVISTTFGVGDGSTTFNLPNTKGKFVAGYDPGDADYNAINDTGGEKTHTLTTTEMPIHSHGVTDGGHSHQTVRNSLNSGTDDISSSLPIMEQWSGSGDTDYHVRGTTDGEANVGKTSLVTTGISINNSGSGAAHENRPPFITLMKIIKY